MRRGVTLLLSTLLAITSIAAVSLSAFAEGGRILDGRWLCSNIAGNVTEDTPAELKDDFGLYVNKPWILQAEFTPGVPTVSNQTEVQIDVMNRLIDLMKDESLTGHDAELVHKLYAMTGDWDYRNAQGLSPALPYMQAIAGIDSLDALLKYFCSEDRLTSTVPFNAHIAPDDTDLAIYTVYVEPSGLMLDDPEEYVERTPQPTVPLNNDSLDGAKMILIGNVLTEEGESEVELGGPIRLTEEEGRGLSVVRKPISQICELDADRVLATGEVCDIYFHEYDITGKMRKADGM